jgi:hypothetical protein
MDLEQWAVPRLRELLPLDDAELKQIIAYTRNLSDAEAEEHLTGLLDNSPTSREFISSFIKHRAAADVAPPAGPPPSSVRNSMNYDGGKAQNGFAQNGSTPAPAIPAATKPTPSELPPSYGNTSTSTQVGGWAPASSASAAIAGQHTNPIIEAGRLRAKDEQQMQQALQDLQYEYRIYNSDIEPEHETEYYCNCSIHQYQRRKWYRLGVQERWSRAVMYPGEKSYNDSPNALGGSGGFLWNNPYTNRISMTPFGSRWNRSTYVNSWGVPIVRPPQPRYYTQWIQEVIALNNQLNQEAQMKIDAKEPAEDIWAPKQIDGDMAGLSLEESSSAPPEKSNGFASEKGASKKNGKAPKEKDKEKKSKFASFKKAMGVKSAEEKADELASGLRDAILAEEYGRWPDEQWRQIVATYQEKVGMTKKIAELRHRRPIQYLHLLRAGYFEPIPVAWATQASNPLKFSIESVGGWRGITPNWRGYEDLAEERLYWVINHREGSAGTRMKPDFISEMNMARDRMAKAVEPPPLYYSPDDTFRLQHISSGYSRQVMPAPFRAYDRPENASDDTMVLLDVSGSMDFKPVRPCYDQYFITGYTNSVQPKNKGKPPELLKASKPPANTLRRCRAGHRPPLHRCHGEPRPQRTRVRPDHLLGPLAAHRDDQPPQPRFEMAQCALRRRHTCHDGLAEGERPALPEALRQRNPSPCLRLAGWSRHTHAASSTPA